MDIVVDGLKAHVATGGRDPVAEEPVVILIHGSGMDRTSRRDLVCRLAFGENKD